MLQGENVGDDQPGPKESVNQHNGSPLYNPDMLRLAYEFAKSNNTLTLPVTSLAGASVAPAARGKSEAALATARREELG